MSTSASSCPKCGARVSRTKWWLWGPLGLFVLLFIYGAITGPKTTADLAEMETAQCMRRQGDGEWRASSGITLETFCKTKGALTGLKRACELNPSKC